MMTMDSWPGAGAPLCRGGAAVACSGSSATPPPATCAPALQQQAAAGDGGRVRRSSDCNQAQRCMQWGIPVCEAPVPVCLHRTVEQPPPPASAEQWCDERAGRCTSPHRQSSSLQRQQQATHADANRSLTFHALHPRAPWGWPQPPHAAAELAAAARPAAFGPPPSRPYRRAAATALGRLAQRLSKPRLAWRRMASPGGPGSSAGAPDALAYRALKAGSWGGSESWDVLAARAGAHQLEGRGLLALTGPPRRACCRCRSRRCCRLPHVRLPCCCCHPRTRPRSCR